LENPLQALVHGKLIAFDSLSQCNLLQQAISSVNVVVDNDDVVTTFDSVLDFRLGGRQSRID
jgi:hypothetical protein